MRWMPLTAGVLLSVLLSGCPQVEPLVEPPPQTDPTPVDPVPPPAEPLTVEELCAMRAASSRNAGNLCIQGHVFSAEDWTEEERAHFCRPGTDARKWAERLLAAQAAGRIEIDWSRARSCVDQSRALRARHTGIELQSNPDWAALRTGSCADFFRGTVEEGGSCDDDWECERRDLGCFTATPSVPGSRVCAPYAAEGESCSEGHTLCGEGLFCNESDLCQPKFADFIPCVADVQCASNRCVESETGPVCAGTPSKKLGESCVMTSECEGYDSGCISCRANGQGAVTCQTLGGEGAACTTWDDCAWDLGCSGGVCTTVGEGEACSGSSFGKCAEGLDCIYTVDCPAIFDADECGAAGSCIWLSDAAGGACVMDTGICGVLPSSGACAGVGACADEAWCDRASFTCQPRAGEGEACASWGPGTPCLASLVCSDGICKPECDSDLDCTNGEVCLDPKQEDVRPVCGPRMTMDCEESAQCGEGSYCLFPVDACLALTGEAACEANPDCNWDGTQGCFAPTECAGLDAETCSFYPDACEAQEVQGCSDRVVCEQLFDEESCTPAGCSWNSAGFCENPCSAFHGDASACGASGACAYDAGTGTCASACSSFDTEAACTAVASCQYGAMQVCVNKVDCSTLTTPAACNESGACTYAKAHCTSAPEARSECRPKLQPGEEVVGYCQVGQDVGTEFGYGASEACSTGACYISAPGELGVCLERTNYGCFGDNATGMMLSFSFLFGLVWLQRRHHQDGRRRRKVPGTFGAAFSNGRDG